MIRFKLIDVGPERWVADDSVPNFPTRESYLDLFEGHNLRAPESVGGYEQEDLETQDRQLIAGGLRSWGNPSYREPVA